MAQGQTLHREITEISRPGGYEVYRLGSNMPKSQKKTQSVASKFFVTSQKYSKGDYEKRHDLKRTETERHNF